MKKRFKVSLVLAAALLACVLVGSVAAGTEEESDLSKAKQIIESHRSVPHVKLSDNEKLQAPDNAKDGVTYGFEYSTSSDGQWDQSKTTASATFYFPADDSHGTKQVLDGERGLGGLCRRRFLLGTGSFPIRVFILYHRHGQRSSQFL